MTGRIKPRKYFFLHRKYMFIIIHYIYGALQGVVCDVRQVITYIKFKIFRKIKIFIKKDYKFLIINAFVGEKLRELILRLKNQ